MPSKPKHKNKTTTPKSGSNDLKHILEEFPSPPKKDGTKDKEKILAKQRREAREAEEARANAGSSSGGKKA